MTTEVVYVRGDITRLRVECIVNAANESGLGCFTPGHKCVDHQIHERAGASLAKECQRKFLHCGIPTGTAAITWGHRLPCTYIIHTTGPRKRADGWEDHALLAQCYKSCLTLAHQHKIREIAFCPISTGMFGFSKGASAFTSLRAVVAWIQTHPSSSLTRVIFCCFGKQDWHCYTVAFQHLFMGNALATNKRFLHGARPLAKGDARVVGEAKGLGDGSRKGAKLRDNGRGSERGQQRIKGGRAGKGSNIVEKEHYTLARSKSERCLNHSSAIRLAAVHGGNHHIGDQQLE